MASTILGAFLKVDNHSYYRSVPIPCSSEITVRHFPVATRDVQETNDYVTCLALHDSMVDSCAPNGQTSLTAKNNLTTPPARTVATLFMNSCHGHPSINGIYCGHDTRGHSKDARYAAQRNGSRAAHPIATPFVSLHHPRLAIVGVPHALEKLHLPLEIPHQNQPLLYIYFLEARGRGGARGGGSWESVSDNADGYELSRAAHTSSRYLTTTEVHNK